MTDPPVDAADTFVARLGHLLLVAFAAGQSVEGEYDLRAEAEMIPGIHVSILREDASGGRRAGEGTFELDHDDFGTALETFLLSEYARGVRVDGVWTACYARPSLPEWSVDIEVAEPVTPDPGQSE